MAAEPPLLPERPPLFNRARFRRLSDTLPVVPMRIYYLPGSAAMAAMAAIEETGTPYEAQRIVRRDGRTVEPPDYFEISPTGRVPALVVARVRAWLGADGVGENGGGGSKPATRLGP